MRQAERLVAVDKDSQGPWKINILLHPHAQVGVRGFFADGAGDAGPYQPFDKPPNGLEVR